METEVVLERLKAILDRLDDTNGQLRALNGKVAEHEKWIRERQWVIESISEKIRTLEGKVAEHQSYIDQRAPYLKEFEEMRVDVNALKLWKEFTSGGTAAKVQFASSIIGTVGIVITVLKLFLKA